MGVHAALRDAGGLWFGWSGETTSDSPGETKVFRTGKVTYGLVDLREADLEAYYGGFSNRTLWPLLHYRLDLATFDHQWYATYRRVNRLFAERLQPLLEDNDQIWIQDYHLIPMATELRRLGVQARIGFFLHIPWPPAELTVTLPWHRQLASDICAYDVVGFQTQVDVRHFRQYVVSELQGTMSDDGAVRALGRSFHAEAIPIGIDVDDFATMAGSRDATNQAKRVKDTLHGRGLIIGVDRLDYTKGIQERLRAFELLMQDYPSQRRAVTFMQISAPSREQVPEYADLRRSVEGLAGHINGTYSEADWVPLRYINRSYSRRALSGFFRMSDVCLVTSLRDGMNLVALEYVAAQLEDSPGALVVSRFAGCAGYLDGAIVVNPYDHAQVAEQLHSALIMGVEERRERWRRMIEGVRKNDIHAWRNRFLKRLTEGTPSTDEVVSPVPYAAS